MSDYFKVVPTQWPGISEIVAPSSNSDTLGAFGGEADPSLAQGLLAGTGPAAQTVVDAAKEVGARFEAEVVSRLPSAGFTGETRSVAATGFEASLTGSLTDGEEWMATTGFPGRHTYNIASFDAQQRALITIQRIAAEVVHVDGPCSRIINDVRSKLDRPFDEAVVRTRFTAAINEARKGLRTGVQAARQQHAATVDPVSFISEVRQKVSSDKLFLRDAQASFEAGILTIFGEAVANVAESAFKEAVARYDAIASYKEAANDIIDKEARRIIGLVDMDPALPPDEKDEFKRVIGEVSEQVKATIAQGAAEAVESSLDPDPDALCANLKRAIEDAAEQAATREEQAQISNAAKGSAGVVAESDGDASSVDDLNSASDTDSEDATPGVALRSIIDEEARRAIKELADGDPDFTRLLEIMSDRVKDEIEQGARDPAGGPPDRAALRNSLKRAFNGILETSFDVDGSNRWL